MFHLIQLTFSHLKSDKFINKHKNPFKQENSIRTIMNGYDAKVLCAKKTHGILSVKNRDGWFLTE